MREYVEKLHLEKLWLVEIGEIEFDGILQDHREEHRKGLRSITGVKVTWSGTCRDSLLLLQPCLSTQGTRTLQFLFISLIDEAGLWHLG